MIQKSLFIVSILIFCALGQWSLQLGTDWLQYSRTDIETGQWWRFLTGNFIHLNWRHLTMNAVGLIVIYLLFPKILSVKKLVVVLVLSCLSVTLGLWLFSPTVYWYVGLSGALHGILVVLLILDYAHSKSALSIVLLALIMAKLVWEITMGPLPGSESTAGGPVVVEAHSYGALGSLLVAGYILIKNYIKNKY